MSDIAPSPAAAPTRWPVFWVTFGAGIVAAAHIGKLPPALPLIRADLGAGLVVGGWMASMISCTGFAVGLFAGSIADRLGQRRVLVWGLLAMVVGSVLGALATSGAILLAARFVEGIGFTAATITGGAITIQVTAARDRKWALGIWSSYVPVGFAGMLLVGAAVLEAFDWRILWWLSAAVTAIWTAVFLAATAGWQRTQRAARSTQSLLRNVRWCLRSTGAVLVAACFALYAAQHISMMSWLPTYLHELYGVTALVAAAVPAAVLAFNAGGNWLSASLMRRGVPIWLLLTAGAAGMALTQTGLFSPAVPDGVRLALAAGFGVLGGMVPAASLGAVAVYTPAAALVGTMNGLMVMATNTGQLFGPPALAAARAAAGNWHDVVWLPVGLAVAGAVLGLMSKSLERRAPR